MTVGQLHEELDNYADDMDVVVEHEDTVLRTLSVEAGSANLDVVVLYADA